MTSKFAEQFIHDVEKRANEKLAVSTGKWLNTAMSPLVATGIANKESGGQFMKDMVASDPKFIEMLNSRGEKANSILNALKKFVNIDTLDGDNFQHVVNNIPATFIRKNM